MIIIEEIQEIIKTTKPGGVSSRIKSVHHLWVEITKYCCEFNFKLEPKEQESSYWFVKPKEEKLYHRITYAKHKLVKMGFSEDLTEVNH